jgi:plasmid stabilization system protein ParE
MRVIWLPQAKKQLRQTSIYILREFGQKARNKFMQDVRHTNILLADNPNMGPIEPLLADRIKKYRSCVVNRQNKIIYFIKDEHIEVADFWDCRREPKKLVQEL